MEYTTVQDVFDSFESSFRDKEVIPEGLKLVWLKKAVARYSIELDPIEFNEDDMVFEPAISQYTIDTLAKFMKQMYQEREVSKVNKRVSIVSRDLSIDGNNGSKTAAFAPNLNMMTQKHHIWFRIKNQQHMYKVVIYHGRRMVSTKITAFPT